MKTREFARLHSVWTLTLLATSGCGPDFDELRYEQDSWRSSARDSSGPGAIPDGEEEPSTTDLGTVAGLSNSQSESTAGVEALGESQQAAETNPLLSLQSQICFGGKQSGDLCLGYQLNARPGPGGYCPYSNECADGGCQLGDVLHHFCFCVYFLTTGRTEFLGAQHDCVAEYKAALEPGP